MKKSVMNHETTVLMKYSNFFNDSTESREVVMEADKMNYIVNLFLSNFISDLNILCTRIFVVVVNVLSLT